MNSWLSPILVRGRVRVRVRVRWLSPILREVSKQVRVIAVHRAFVLGLGARHGGIVVQSVGS